MKRLAVVNGLILAALAVSLWSVATPATCPATVTCNQIMCRGCSMGGQNGNCAYMPFAYCAGNANYCLGTIQGTNIQCNCSSTGC